jgi:DegV family protein with EDD domain
LRSKPIPKVRVVTDSTSCLPPELIEKFEIEVLPVGLVIDGKHYRDYIDITRDDILRRIENMEQQPSTTAVSPGDFVHKFEELSKITDSIVCILVSRALTASHESAYQAKRHVRRQNTGAKIEIIDSKTSAGALSFVVMEAARAAQEGKTMAEVIEVARDMISRVIYIAAPETLKYLINIGRAPKSANIGEMLDVKPIIGFIDDTGLLEVVTRVRGKSKTLSRIVDLIDKYADTDRPINVIVHYTDGMEDANQLKDLIMSRYNCAEILVIP